MKLDSDSLLHRSDALHCLHSLERLNLHNNQAISILPDGNDIDGHLQEDSSPVLSPKVIAGTLPKGLGAVVSRALRESPQRASLDEMPKVDCPSGKGVKESILRSRPNDARWQIPICKLTTLVCPNPYHFPV